MSTAAIIAGGGAQRLGGLDKWTLAVGGRRILDRQFAVLGQVAEHVLIVTNDPHRFQSAGVRVCADLVPGAGPLGGLYTALVRSPTEHTIVVACDLPFLTAPFLRYLTSRVGAADAAVPYGADGVQPLCAVYRRACAAVIRARLERGEHRVAALTEALRIAHVDPAEIAPFDPDDTLFLNVNTPADHRRAVDLADRAARRRMLEPDH